jgi:hypothetical protein
MAKKMKATRKKMQREKVIKFVLSKEEAAALKQFQKAYRIRTLSLAAYRLVQSHI